MELLSHVVALFNILKQINHLMLLFLYTFSLEEAMFLLIEERKVLGSGLAM